MLKNLIRYTLVGGIALATVFATEYATQEAVRHAATDWYSAQGYIPDRDIQFSPVGLQTYTQQSAIYANQSSALARVAIWLFGVGAIGVVLSPGSGKAVDRGEALFKQWIAAARKNDSLEMARIETEVQNVGVGHE